MPLFYASYIVNETEVIVGCRPTSKKELEPGFYDSVSAWISVTDRTPPFLVEKPYFWFPFVEFRHFDLFRRPVASPTKECLFATLKTLDKLVQAKVPRIYLHCDAGTHRAPLLFGLYLIWYHAPIAADVVAKRTYYRTDERHSDPLYYADCHLKDYPADREFLTWVRTTSDETSLEEWFKWTPIERLEFWLKTTFNGLTTTLDRGLLDDDLWTLHFEYKKLGGSVSWKATNENSLMITVFDGHLVNSYESVQRHLDELLRSW